MNPNILLMDHIIFLMLVFQSHNIKLFHTQIRMYIYLLILETLEKIHLKLEKVCII